MAIKYIIGVDEVGRGPVAGPLAVAVVQARSRKETQKYKGIKDSKKLTPRKREEWFDKAQQDKNVKCQLSFVTPQRIDKIGIAKAARIAVARALAGLGTDPKKCLVLLDGGLKAPRHFVFQKTIVRGDEKEKIISIASVVAKVTRDRRMMNYSKKFPEYEFHRHKGYGTKAHLSHIKKNGVCDIHRKSFLKKVLK